MPDASNARLPILLAGWVLQDGNDDNFVAGTRREFALEFSVDFDRPLQHVQAGELGLRATGSYGDYEVTARVAHNNIEGAGYEREDVCWILDFGVVMAYSTHAPQTLDGLPPRVGDTLQGTVSLAVDHFVYFEELANVPGVPPLIYSRDVEAVEIDVTQQETGK